MLGAAKSMGLIKVTIVACTYAQLSNTEHST